jgi:hypothetical protein
MYPFLNPLGLGTTWFSNSSSIMPKLTFIDPGYPAQSCLRKNSAVDSHPGKDGAWAQKFFPVK